MFPRSTQVGEVAKELKVFRIFVAKYYSLGRNGLGIALASWAVDSVSIVILRSHSAELLVVYRIALQLAQPVALVASVSASYFLNHVASAIGDRVLNYTISRKLVLIHLLNGTICLVVTLATYFFATHVFQFGYNLPLSDAQSLAFMAPLIAYFNGISAGNNNALKSFIAVRSLKVIAFYNLVLSAAFIGSLMVVGADIVFVSRLALLAIPLAVISSYKLRGVLTAA